MVYIPEKQKQELILFGIDISKVNSYKHALYLLRKARKKAKRTRLKNFATQLNDNLPNSERWFNDLYKEHRHSDDKANIPFALRIPDIINKTYKYIIEIDGSAHNSAKARRHDGYKTKLYEDRYFKVFRIKAYNLEQAKDVIKQIVAYRAEKDGHAKSGPIKRYTKEEIKELEDKLKSKP